MTTPSLTDFLLARYAEDEDAARWVASGHGAHWKLREVGHEMIDDETGSEVVTYGGVRNLSDAEHIARHDPARVLADVEAKRRIVEEHSPREVASMDRETWGQSFTVCRRCCDTMNGKQIVAPCPTLRLLALPFADHPDYQGAWKP